MSQPLLQVKDLGVEVEGIPIIRRVNLQFASGKVYAVLGPNASGKSTLAKTIMGLPEYRVAQGDILMHGESILNKTITERAKMGIAYAFQMPPGIPGIKFEEFICNICPQYACKEEHENFMGESCSCRQELHEEFERLGIEKLSNRDLNVGFSGGEMKRSELFQVLSLKPKIMFLDEPDSGLDYDSLKLVGRELKAIKDKGETTMVIISHHRYILEFLAADEVFILEQGKNVHSGTMDDIPILEELGYERFLARAGG